MRRYDNPANSDLLASQAVSPGVIDPFIKIRRRSPLPIPLDERKHITNKLELPQAIIDAILNDTYSKGNSDASITELIGPAQIAILREKHAHEIVEDASDRIWSLLGQSIHTILERANREAIAERRLSMEIEGWVVSGGMDVYEEKGILSDYKVTSVWKVIKGDLDEWVKQLNCYAVLLRHHNHKIEKLQVIAILRDWSKREAERDPTYPQAQVVNIPIALWEPDEAFKFLRERVILHKQARVSETLPECTPEERWAKAAVWAVMKKGRKTAIKLYTNEQEAKLHVGFDRTLYVSYRPGESVRCKSYCPVSKFCQQYQKELEGATAVVEEVEDK